MIQYNKNQLLYYNSIIQQSCHQRHKQYQIHQNKQSQHHRHNKQKMHKQYYKIIKTHKISSQILPLFYKQILLIVNIYHNNTNRIENLQKAASVYLSKHVKNIFKTRNQQLINSRAQKILTLLTSFKINSIQKIHISKSLQFLLASDRTKIIRSAFQPNLITLLTQSEQQTDDLINFQFLVFFGQIMMNNPGLTEEVEKFIAKSFSPFVKLNLRVITLLQQALLAKNGQAASKLMFLVRQYFNLLKIYLKRFILISQDTSKLLYSQQLVKIVVKSLQLQLPNNLLTYPIFHLASNPSPQQKIFNEIKCNTISFLNNFIRTLLSIIKQKKFLQLNPLYNKTNQLLPILIKSSQQLMKSHGPYYKIIDFSILNTLDIIYSFFTTTIRANSFYQIFVQHKQKMIQDLIFRALMLTPHDYQNFYSQPTEFVNSIMQIVKRDIKLKTNKTMNNDQDQNEDEDEMFNNLRTNAAEFLNTFCKYQDGTLTEIMQYAFLILQGKLNSQFSPSLMFIVLSILKDISKQRRDLHLIIGNLIIKLLTEMEIPKKTTQQPQSKNNKELDIQYSLAFLTMSQYFSPIQAVDHKIVEFAFKICHKLLNDPKVQQVPKLISFQILQVINRQQYGQKYCPQILKAFNSILQNQQKPSQKLLQSYYTLIKYNDIMLKQKCYKQLCHTINLMSTFIHKQIQSPNRQQIIINKLWNVIREVGQNSEFIPLMIEPIENVILPLLKYVDTENDFDFEEDILMLMSAFIGKSKNVTNNQLKIFEIIPKIFYNNYKAMFGHAFQTLQVFIYYGKQILKTSPAAIQSIIQMSLTSISHCQYKGKKLSQAQNCEGALILQSLIIACGLSIQSRLYQQIANIVIKRISQNLKFNFFKANLSSLLALVLIHNCTTFQASVSEHILSVILNSLQSFHKVQHAPKILIFSLNKLIHSYSFPFIFNRFTQILDTIITLLQLSVMRKQNPFEQDDQDEYRDHSNSLHQTINQIINLDEFQDFKNQIKILQEKNIELIQKTVNQLPQSKKDFLRHVLAVQRVSNQPRKIFKIKRQQ